MLKKWIKKLPIINCYYERKLLVKKYKDSQHQLQIAINRVGENCLKLLATKKDLNLSGQKKIIRTPNLTCSLTSFGQRIYSVHLTILSLLNQTIEPERFILWLSESEYKINELPKELLALQDYGLTIAFCEDIGSYKKLIPTLEKYPDDMIVTFDDDVIYPEDQLEKLYKAHSKYPGEIICHRAHKLLKNNHGVIKPYLQWQFDVCQSRPGIDIFPIGIGGVLYPPNSLHKDILNDSLFMEICPEADDFWFKAMAQLKGTLVKVVDDPLPYEDYLQLPSTMQNTLWQKNINNNDKQLKSIIATYPELTF